MGKVEQERSLVTGHSQGLQARSLSQHRLLARYEELPLKQWHICAWECYRGAGFLFG